MQKTFRTISDAALFGFVALICFFQACGALAFAPPPPGSMRGVPPEVALARVCVKEAGFRSVDDCAGIVAVLERVGRGDVVRGAAVYSPSIFDASRLRSRPWIADLHADGRRPRLWGRAGPWERYRADWLAQVAHARELLARSAARCEAHHWGDQYGDRARAERAGWEELDCGDTKNSFWRVPWWTDRE